MFEDTSLPEIAAYHEDCEGSLRLFFSEISPQYQARFLGYRKDEIAKELQRRIAETNTRSALVILARLEATFRLDYKLRAQRKLPDNISIKFRKIWKEKGEKARLDEDIFTVWKSNTENHHKYAIGEMKKFFRLRHWIAHGRYWVFSYPYDYDDIYAIADYILTELPFEN